MPVERVSKGFKDISLSFLKNPITNDVVVLNNETAIARSVRNIVLTRLNEVFFDPEFGVQDILFENIDGFTLSTIKTLIESAIKRYEPRVNLLETNVELVIYDNGINITVRYQIIGIDIPPQQLSFAIVNTR